MKRIILSLALFVSFLSNAQAPQGVNYQAVIRNTNGTTVNNAAVGLRLNILQGSATGTVVYSESFSETTSNIGLVNVVLGQGNVLSGTFSSINWGAGPYFLEIAADANGGTNYTVMGAQQMMSVPYALYAENSGTPGPQGVTGPQGPAGVDGTDGQNGLSAYEVWLSLGNSGTEADFISSLIGPQGATGLQGPAGVDGTNGIDGQNGMSAYEVWLSQGNTGTEADYLTSITGPQGTPGSLDAWGLNGNTGTTPTTNFIGTTDAQDWVVKTNNAERMRVNSNGDIGIGISNPSSKLDVNGNMELSGNLAIGTSTPIVPLTFDGGAGDRISFFYTSPNSLYGMGIQNQLLQMYTNGSASDIAFGHGSSFAFTERVRFKGNGRVGIGTSSPSGKLHVNNDVSGADSSFVVTTAGKVGIGTASPNGHLTVRGGIGSAVDSAHVLLYNKYFQTGSPQLKLYSTDNSSTGAYGIQALKAGVGSGNMVLNESGGNVGVGTSSPARTLHVNAVMRLEPIPTAPASPAKGDMYFDSTLNKLRVYDGTTWQNCW
jgi:hypothetical protein